MKKNLACPLCEQSLSTTAHTSLHLKFDYDKRITTHQINRLDKALVELKRILKSQHTLMQELKIAREKKQLAIHQEQELAKTIRLLKSSLEEHSSLLKKHKESIVHEENVLVQIQKELQQIVQEYPARLAHDKGYQALLQRINALEKKCAELSYDQSTYENLIKRKNELCKNEADLHGILKNKALQEQRKEEIHILCSTLKQRKKELHTIAQQLQRLSYLQETQQNLEQQHEQAQTTIKELQKTKEQLLYRHGILEQQSRIFAQKKQELALQEQIINSLEGAISDYQAVVHTLSKDGIQALLIEDAIPEIEQEANALLAQLTDNQAHLSIESLRDLKSGGTRETLDIKISDALGIRPYELFSGGEAFRIDFALRIALSKLLARRAGTSLQTLIIDEGFGSQDEEGIVHIMDALHKIQNHFAKIIIVSHLSSMKEQFPVHFLVSKGPHGSLVRVIEHG